MNNYIYEYYQAITDGTIIVGRWVRLWYEYIINGLQDKRFFYDAKKANKAIRFIETFCRHHEGSLAPNLIKLELWQKALVSVIFGVVNDDRVRQFVEVCVIIGRKNGKSLLMAAISEYVLYLGEYGTRIYFVAPKLDQSRICYEALYQMILKEPELSELTKKRRTDIYIQSTNSSAQPLAFSAKKSDGLNPSLVVADEIAAWSGEAGLRQWEVMKSAMGARKEPLMIAISTANFVHDSIYDELIKRSTSVLLGTSKETRLAPFLYMIDDVEKWNDINELQKSNPNLGVSVSVSYLLEEIAVAEGSLSKKSEFIVKYANIQQNSSTAWLDTKTINQCFGDHIELEDYRGSYAICGLDLSMTTDLTAACVVIPKNGRLNVFTQFFLPANKIEEASARDGLPYQIYIERGLLTPSGDNIIDYNDAYKWFTDLIERYEIYPQYLGYDRYSSQYIVQALKAYGFKCEDVYQGENLTGIILDTEGKLKDGVFFFGDNDLMKAHLLGSAVKINAENNRRKLVKLDRTVHIDGMAALLDAMTMWQNHNDELQYRLYEGEV